MHICVYIYVYILFIYAQIFFQISPKYLHVPFIDIPINDIYAVFAWLLNPLLLDILQLLVMEYCSNVYNYTCELVSCEI